MPYAFTRLMQEFDVDGVYLDGTSRPKGCKNYLHGCGYKNNAGEICETYPIFAVREQMKRIYNICAVKHKGLVSVHQSGYNIIPCLAFATSYWDGEQFNVPLKDEPLNILPLETFQAEFMGRNFGVPAEFLTYAPFVWTADEALAFTLLHDVAIRPINVGPMLLSMSKIWKVFDKFDLDNAEFVGYWQKQDLLKADHPDVKISYYSSLKSGKILVIAANLGSKKVETKILFNLKKNHGNKTQISDAISKQKLACGNNSFNIELDKLQARILIIF